MRPRSPLLLAVLPLLAACGDGPTLAAGAEAATPLGAPAPVVESTPPPDATVGFFLSGRSTPFTLTTATATYRDVPNDALFLAYNLAVGTINDKVVAEEPLLKFGLEARYRDDRLEDWLEWNLDYRSADDRHAARHLAYRVSRVTHRTDWAFAAPGGEIRLESTMNAREFVFDPATGEFQMGGGALYVNGGALLYRSPSGRLTVLAGP